MQIYSCTPYAVFLFPPPPPPSSATFSHFTLHFKKPLKWQIGCAALRYRTHPTSSGRESVNFISATGNCVYGVALQQARHCPLCLPVSLPAWTTASLTEPSTNADRLPLKICRVLQGFGVVGGQGSCSCRHTVRIL